jgi:hypothetical protein
MAIGPSQVFQRRENGIELGFLTQARVIDQHERAGQFRFLLVDFRRRELFDVDHLAGEAAGWRGRTATQGNNVQRMLHRSDDVSRGRNFGFPRRGDGPFLGVHVGESQGLELLFCPAHRRLQVGRARR